MQTLRSEMIYACDEVVIILSRTFKALTSLKHKGEKMSGIKPITGLLKTLRSNSPIC